MLRLAIIAFGAFGLWFAYLFATALLAVQAPSTVSAATAVTATVPRPTVLPNPSPIHSLAGKGAEPIPVWRSTDGPETARSLAKGGRPSVDAIQPLVRCFAQPGEKVRVLPREAGEGAFTFVIAVDRRAISNPSVACSGYVQNSKIGAAR